MSTTDQPGCPMTIAYIAIGAGRAFQQSQELQDSPVGEADLVAGVIAHAGLLDRLYDELRDRFSGVFLYDIAEPFGEGLGAVLFARGTDQAEPALAEELARNLFADHLDD